MPPFQDSHCPQCDSGLPLKVLWEFSRSSTYGLVARSGVLKGRIGVVCPNCGAKLRVVQTRIRAFLFMVWAAALGGAWSVGAWLRNAHVVLNQKFEFVGLAVLMSAIFLLQKYCIPYLAQVRLADPGERLGFPLSGA